MKKSILSLLLAVVLTFGATQGMVSAFASAESNKDTPVAQIANDDYVPFNHHNEVLSLNNNTEKVINELNKTAKSFGGSVEQYSSEEEYSKSLNAVQHSDDFGGQEQISQIIRVMTTATGSEKFGNYTASKPIQNAIVRINGVPRYTDRNGEIKVTVDEGYAELFIEKTGYNPYIEIYEFAGNEKVVNLKKPQDDIYFEYAMFDYCGDIANVLIQDSYFSLGDEYYYAILDVKTNVLADEYRLYCDGSLVEYNDIGSFTIFNFEDFSKIGSTLSIQAVYQGIESDMVDLNVHIMKQLEQEDICNPDDISVDVNLDGVDNQRIQDSGITPFGSFNLDLSDALQRLFELFDSRSSAELNFSLDRKKGTIQMLIGYSYEVKRAGADGLQDKIDQKDKEIAKLDKKKDKEKIEKLKSEKIDLIRKKQAVEKEDLENFGNVYRDVRTSVEQAQKGKRSLKSMINKLDQLKKLKKKAPAVKSILQKAPALTVDFQILGAVEFSLKEGRFVDVGLAVSIEGRAEWKEQFVIVYVPVFLRIGAGVKFEADFSFYSEYEKGNYGFNLEDFFTFTVTVMLWAEVGVGFCDLLSVSLRGEGALEFVFKTKSDFFQMNGEASLALKIKALLWEFDVTLVSRRWEDITKSSNNMKLAKAYYLANNYELSDNGIVSNIYDVTQPKLTKFGDKQILTWIEYSDDRDIYNSTILKYSILESEGWTDPKPIYDTGKADFDYDIYYDLNGGTHITWQTSNRLFTENDTLESMSSASEIYVADINANGNIENITLVSSNDILDFAPRFVKQETVQDPVSLIWRRNSLNNIMGFNGVNSFVLSSALDWSKTSEVASFDQFVSFGDAAYINGDLNAAFILDEDGDLTTNDFNIYCCDKSGIKNITNDPTYYSSLNYVKNGEKYSLQFIKELKMYNYVNKELCPAIETNFSTVNAVTLIENEEAGIKLAYYTMKQDNIQQLYCSLYDNTTGLWSENIALTNEAYDVSKATVVINDNGSLDMSYIVTDFDSNTSVLCYATRSFHYNLMIEEAFIDENIKIGQDFTINLSLLNTGDLPLTNVNLLIGEKQENIVFEKPLKSGENTFIETLYRIDNFNIEHLTLKAYYGDVYSEYQISLNRVDYELSVDKIINNGKQVFNINIKQLSELTSNFVLYIRVNGIEVYSQEVTSQECLNLSYIFDNIKDNDLIVFEVVPSADEYDYTNNKVSFFSTQTEESVSIVENTYSSSLTFAKEILA